MGYEDSGLPGWDQNSAPLAFMNCNVDAVGTTLAAIFAEVGATVVVTYDENGGFWDHVAPPRADRWGPGTRIPTIIVSPYAKKGFVDHATYDTTSIIRLIEHRYGLQKLPGITARDKAMAARHEAPMGDLTHALVLPR